jgi:hypothetical protein
MLSGERRDRNQLDKLPGLSQYQQPAFQTPFGPRLSLQRCGHSAVALRIVRDAISRPPDAVSHLLLRALRDLRQPRIAAHRRRARAGRDGDSLADARAPRAALRTLPPQIFFRKTAATRRAISGPRAERVTTDEASDALKKLGQCKPAAVTLIAEKFASR